MQPELIFTIVIVVVTIIFLFLVILLKIFEEDPYAAPKGTKTCNARVLQKASYTIDKNGKTRPYYILKLAILETKRICIYEVSLDVYNSLQVDDTFPVITLEDEDQEDEEEER